MVKFAPGIARLPPELPITPLTLSTVEGLFVQRTAVSVKPTTRLLAGAGVEATIDAEVADGDVGDGVSLHAAKASDATATANKFMTFKRFISSPLRYLSGFSDHSIGNGCTTA